MQLEKSPDTCGCSVVIVHDQNERAGFFWCLRWFRSLMFFGYRDIISRQNREANGEAAARSYALTFSRDGTSVHLYKIAYQCKANAKSFLAAFALFDLLERQKNSFKRMRTQSHAFVGDFYFGEALFLSYEKGNRVT